MTAYFLRERLRAVLPLKRHSDALKHCLHSIELALEVIDTTILLRSWASIAKGARRALLTTRRVATILRTETVLAVHRLLAVRTERNLGHTMAARAFSVVHLARTERSTASREAAQTVETLTILEIRHGYKC